MCEYLVTVLYLTYIGVQRTMTYIAGPHLLRDGIQSTERQRAVEANSAAGEGIGRIANYETSR